MRIMRCRLKKSGGGRFAGVLVSCFAGVFGGLFDAFGARVLRACWRRGISWFG